MVVRRIRVLLVEDHAMVRQGLRALLDRETDLQVVGEAADGNDAIRLAEELLPDVVVMDAGLPGVSGIQATRAIVQRNPRVKILALSMHEDSDTVFGMLRAGAKGYQLKQAAVTELAEAIRNVYSGRSALHPAIARYVVDAVSRQEMVEQAEGELTEREREILELVAAGQTSREIGDRLGLSARTVDAHRAQILAKLDARNKVEAIITAIRRGLISSNAIPRDRDSDAAASLEMRGLA
ncbi:MAG: response regulator transcription factor [Chloroflexi bacterium]|nr:response regulator transcription factor [Chloroflexota bacterium]